MQQPVEELRGHCSRLKAAEVGRRLSRKPKFLFLFSEAFVVNFFLRKPSLLIGKGERGPMSRSQTDKHTHTALHTRTPPPRLGRRETRYSFAYSLPGPSIFSGIFSNIENIFVTRQVKNATTNTKMLQDQVVENARERSKLTDLACIDPKPTVKGQKSCLEKL